MQLEAWFFMNCMQCLLQLFMAILLPVLIFKDAIHKIEKSCQSYSPESPEWHKCSSLVIHGIVEEDGLNLIAIISSLVMWTLINIYFTIAMRAFYKTWQRQSQRPQVVPLRMVQI